MRLLISIGTETHTRLKREVKNNELDILLGGS